MPITDPAVKIQYNTIPFLTAAQGAPFGGAVATGMVTGAQVRGYIASIGGYLWRKTDGASAALRVRLQAVVSDPMLKTWLANRDTIATAFAPSPANLIGMLELAALQRLDHIAFDLKIQAGHAYECTPIEADEAKTLHKLNSAGRDSQRDVIELFEENSCADGDAGIQTVCHLPPPDATWRIDRENISAPPAPRYWTYRLQTGRDTNGGILMETGVTFRLASIHEAFEASMQSVPLKAAGEGATAPGFYRRLSAPPWLRAIVSA